MSLDYLNNKKNIPNIYDYSTRYSKIHRIFTAEYYRRDIGQISCKLRTANFAHRSCKFSFLCLAKEQIRIQSKIFTLAIGTAISDIR